MTTRFGKRAVHVILLSGLGLLGVAVLRPFLIPVVWAFIIAYVTWPSFQRMTRLTGSRRSLAALLMTMLVTLGLVVPLLLLTMPLTSEAVAFGRQLAAWFANGHRALPRPLSEIPWLGAWGQGVLDDIAREPSAWRTQLAQWGDHWIGQAAQLAGGVGRNAVKFGFALLTLYFAYRDGDAILAQAKRSLTPYLGRRLDVYLSAIGDVCRSVVHGVVLTAAAQGALAGIGYWAAGVGAPLLLAMLTSLAALLPFGTPLVWAPAAISLILGGHTWAGIGLLLWGALAVSWIDNVIRPFVISSAGHMPFLLVIFGIVGGMLAFGLIGVFIGPFVISTLLAVWREWQADLDAADGHLPADSGEETAPTDSGLGRKIGR